MSRTDQPDSEISDLIRKLNTVTECDQAAVRLASLGTAAVSALKKFLFEGHPSVVYQPRRAAVEALARIGAKDILIQYLTRNNLIEDAGTRFGDLYRRSARIILETSLDDSIREVDQQLATRLERVTAQITTLLAQQAEPTQSGKIQTFLNQLHEFRSSVEKLGGEPVDATLAPTKSQLPNQVTQCVLCGHLERTLWDFLARAQYDLSTDEDQQHRHASHSGFCPLHTWQYETVSSPQGVCSAYPDVLNRFAERLRALAHEARPVDALAEGLWSLLPGESTCEVCRVLKSVETTLAIEIAGKLSVPDKTIALCAFHVYAVLRASPTPDAADRLLTDLARTLEGLAEEMQNFALKHSAVRHQLTTSTEAQAAFLGLSRLAGSRRIVSPWRID